MTWNREPAYRQLHRVLRAAFDQASQGKGKERHAEQDEPFEKQQICEIGRRLQGNPAAGPLFQSVKKIYESGRLPAEKAIAELYGAINYAVAGILLFEESAWPKEKMQPSGPALQNAAMCEVSTAHITREDNEILMKIAKSGNFDPLIVYAKEDGFIVFVDEDMSDANSSRSEEIAAAELSQNFISLLRLASEQGNWWLLIDQGAIYTEGLQKFDW